MMLRALFAVFLLLCGALSVKAADPQTALFAGGCFWCVETDFDSVPGVLETTSGYAGGTTENPTYKTYVKGGHREVLQIKFDPDKVTFEKLADVLFHTTDPTDGGGQFCDRGFAYSPAIYALNGEQEKEAKAAKRRAELDLAKPVALAIEGPAKFWPAEDYHQNFGALNPIRYNYYRSACGRNNVVRALWGDKAYEGVVTH